MDAFAVAALDIAVRSIVREEQGSGGQLSDFAGAQGGDSIALTLDECGRARIEEQAVLKGAIG